MPLISPDFGGGGGSSALPRLLPLSHTRCPTGFLPTDKHFPCSVCKKLKAKATGYDFISGS